MNTNLDNIYSPDYKHAILNTEDLTSNLEVSILLAKSFVPYSHRRIASDYITMSKIFTYLIVQPRITETEKSLLRKYGFDSLENTTISKANTEIQKLKELATSIDEVVRRDADDLLNIRIKELKYIKSDNYTINTNEMYKGYLALESYLGNITKYYR